MEKENKEPQRMNISVMEKILPKNTDSIFFSEDLCISHGYNFFKNFLSLQNKGPFIVEDYRFGLLLKGEINVKINLIDYHFTTGQSAIIPKGCIAQIKEISDDVEVIGIIISSKLMHVIIDSNNYHNIPSKFLIIETEESEKLFFRTLLQSIWIIVHLEKYPVESLIGLLYSMVQFMNGLKHENIYVHNDYKQDLFNKFIEMVNENCKKEHNISFYADKLCLSHRYFSALIFKQSGKHAKFWIDESLIMNAKVLLRHSSKTINQIAYELNFPNDSFFCKFFKRLTGISPSDYRNKALL